jgi:hypothetical protein
MIHGNRTQIFYDFYDDHRFFYPTFIVLKEIMKSIFLFGLMAVFAMSSCHENSSKNNTKNADSTKQANSAQTRAVNDPFYSKIADENYLIVPGKSIGKLKIGEKTEELQMLGRPQKSDAGMCKSLGSWFYGDSTNGIRKELDIFSECDPADSMRPHVKWIRTTDPVFKTEKGLGVNSSFEDIQTVFPSLEAIGTFTAKNDGHDMVLMNDVHTGITFEIEAEKGKPSGKCRGVVVGKPGEKVPSLYFTFYKDLKYYNAQ